MERKVNSKFQTVFFTKRLKIVYLTGSYFFSINYDYLKHEE
jgi:hypothetical protein